MEAWRHLKGTLAVLGLMIAPKAVLLTFFVLVRLRTFLLFTGNVALRSFAGFLILRLIAAVVSQTKGRLLLHVLNRLVLLIFKLAHL